ncbi:MAG TPA: GNAT family N-acetyltransferase [Dehalococcoidia bacterium]|nr:GNAT family N-acetyltransferase [Dehalococcoidia bacterium]
MDIKVRPVSEALLKKYSTIPLSVEVNSVLDIELLQDGLGGVVFHERELDSPLMKYIEDEPDEIITWPESFDTGRWAVITAEEGGKLTGGLTIACRNPEIINNRILMGIDDLAVVWDIRVRPGYRRQGIGTQLFGKAIEWSRSRGYKQLSVETQNTNVPACRFYIKQGCRLGGINRYAYYHNPSYVDETQFEYYLDLQE